MAPRGASSRRGGGAVPGSACPRATGSSQPQEPGTLFSWGRALGLPVSPLPRQEPRAGPEPEQAGLRDSEATSHPGDTLRAAGPPGSRLLPHPPALLPVPVAFLAVMAGPGSSQGPRQPLARTAMAEVTTGTALQPAAQAIPVLWRSHSWGVPQVPPRCFRSFLHSPRGPLLPAALSSAGHSPACASAGSPSSARPVLGGAPPEADFGNPCVTLNKLGLPSALRTRPCWGPVPGGVTGQ